MSDVLKTVRDLIAENETLKKKMEASEISHSKEYCDLNGKLRDVGDACEHIENAFEESEKCREDMIACITKAMDALRGCDIPSDFETMQFKDFKDHIVKLECAIDSAKSELTLALNNSPVDNELEEDEEGNESQLPSSSSSSSIQSTLTFDEEFRFALDKLGCGTLVEKLLAEKSIVVFGDLVSRVLRGDPIDSVESIDIIAKDVGVFDLFVSASYVLSPWWGEKMSDLVGDVPDGWCVFHLKRYARSTPIRIFVPSSPKIFLTSIPSQLGVLDSLNVVYDGNDVHVRMYTNFLLRKAKCPHKLPSRLTSLGFSRSKDNVKSRFNVPSSNVFSKTDLGIRDCIASDLEKLIYQDTTLEGALAKIVESHDADYALIRKLLDVEGVYVVGDFVRQALLGEHQIKNPKLHLVSLRGIEVVKELIPSRTSSVRVFDRMNTIWIQDTFNQSTLVVCITYPDKVGSEPESGWKQRVGYLTRTHAENTVHADFNITSFDGEEFSIVKLECLLQRRHVSQPSDEILLKSADIDRLKSYGYTFDPTPIVTTSRILKKDDPFDILLK